MTWPASLSDYELVIHACSEHLLWGLLCVKVLCALNRKGSSW